MEVLLLVLALLCKDITALVNYAQSGPFNICDWNLTSKVIPTLPYGKIESPAYPNRTPGSHSCQLSIQVEQDSWIGIYTDHFHILPSGSCIDQNELVISGELSGTVKHFCGLQRGLLYSKYLSSPKSFLHLNFISLGKKIPHTSAVFQLNYIGAKAIHKENRIYPNRAEASNVGHIVSHDSFTEKFGESYGKGINSKLTLTGLQSHMVMELEFLFFDLQESTLLSCQDRLKVSGVAFDGSRKKYVKYCDERQLQNKKFRKLRILGNSVTFQFKTGHTNNIHRGFLLRYTIISEQPQNTMANTNQLITYKLNWLAAVNSTKNSVNSVISFQSNDHARSRMFAGEVRPTKSSNSNDPAKAVTKKSRFNKVNKPDLVGFVQGISTGATFLVIVVVLIIVIIIALKKQRERSEPCYVDNNLFTIRHIPSYNISPHIGSWDRNNTLGSITDDNIYYNDTEMFQPSSDAEDYKDDANIYHVIESRADCEHDLVSSCSSDTEYDLNDNTRSTEGDLDDIKNCSTTASMSKEDSKISEPETNDAEIRSTTLSKLDDKQNNLST